MAAWRPGPRRFGGIEGCRTGGAMSLLGRLSSIVPTSAELDPLAGTDVTLDRDRRGPGTSDAVHLLVYNDPGAPSGPFGLGWTLVVCEGSERPRSVPLDAHGAGVLAETRVAKAVAVRVLTDHGVTVEGWSDGFVSTVATHRALLSS